MRHLKDLKRIFTRQENGSSETRAAACDPDLQNKYYPSKQLEMDDAEKMGCVSNLTPREKETFLLLLKGYTLKEVAQQLGIKYSTVNTYMTTLYKKLFVNSRAELIINYQNLQISNQ